MELRELAQNIVDALKSREERIVLAESCTCGLISATLGTIPGISNHLCGSAVVYRADSKMKWLGVSKKTIKAKTTESHEVVKEMAYGIINKTPEATWAVGIVGHVGPDAPVEKDGWLYGCFVRRTKKGKIKVVDTIHHKLSMTHRIARQQEAVEVVLTHLARLLSKKSQIEEHAKKTKKQVVA